MEDWIVGYSLYRKNRNQLNSSYSPRGIVIGYVHYISAWDCVANVRLKLTLRGRFLVSENLSWHIPTTYQACVIYLRINWNKILVDNSLVDWIKNDPNLDLIGEGIKLKKFRIQGLGLVGQARPDWANLRSTWMGI